MTTVRFLHRRRPGAGRAAGTAALRAVAVVLGVALAGLATATATSGASAAPVEGVGYVRLAHLSPDTPAVDVYLAGPIPAGAAETSVQPTVFEAVGYGQLSEYLDLPVGRYSVAMRTAGAPASQPPVLTTEVTVEAGDAYTVAGVGRYADLGLRVLDDDLSSPTGGQAKVRVIQASVRAPVLDVATGEGPVIATSVQFATTTPYSMVRPGSWTLRLSSPGGTPTTTEVTLDDATVYSLLVLDDRDGGLVTELRVDARGGSVVPTGGVDTGAGGTSGAAGRAGAGWTYLLVALAVPVAAAVVLAWRRRGRATW